MVTPPVKREAVVRLRQAHEKSERRACRGDRLRADDGPLSRRIDDAGLRERLRTCAKERRRFGYRRLHVLLRREGFVANHKRLFRIYREERVVPKRGGRKRALGTRAPIPSRCGPMTAGRSTSFPISWRVGVWPALSHPGGFRRLHPQVSGCRGGYLAFRPRGRAGA